MFSQRGWAPYSEVSIELLGSEATSAPRPACGQPRSGDQTRGAPSEQALVLFSREIAQAATGMAPGLTGIVGGRPTVYPLIRLFSFLIDKTACSVPSTMANAMPSPCPPPSLLTPAAPSSHPNPRAVPMPACRW
jgi:hypothetical protein